MSRRSTTSVPTPSLRPNPSIEKSKPIGQNASAAAGDEFILASMTSAPGDHTDRWNRIIDLLLEAGTEKS